MENNTVEFTGRLMIFIDINRITQEPIGAHLLPVPAFQHDPEHDTEFYFQWLGDALQEELSVLQPLTLFQASVLGIPLVGTIADYGRIRVTIEKLEANDAS